MHQNEQTTHMKEVQVLVMSLSVNNSMHHTAAVEQTAASRRSFVSAYRHLTIMLCHVTDTGNRPTELVK